jgi:hypothetical protein
VCVPYIHLTSKLDEVIGDDEKVDRKDLFTLMGQMYYIYPNHVPEFMQGSIRVGHLCIPRNIDTRILYMNMNTLKWARVKRV